MVCKDRFTLDPIAHSFFIQRDQQQHLSKCKLDRLVSGQLVVMAGEIDQRVFDFTVEEQAAEAGTSRIGLGYEPALSLSL